MKSSNLLIKSFPMQKLYLFKEHQIWLQGTHLTSMNVRFIWTDVLILLFEVAYEDTCICKISAYNRWKLDLYPFSLLWGLCYETTQMLLFGKQLLFLTVVQKIIFWFWIYPKLTLQAFGLIQPSSYYEWTSLLTKLCVK